MFDDEYNEEQAKDMEMLDKTIKIFKIGCAISMLIVIVIILLIIF